MRAMLPDFKLPEYDFSHARRNPHAARLAGAQIVVLDADFTGVFPGPAAVYEHWVPSPASFVASDPRYPQSLVAGPPGACASA